MSLQFGKYLQRQMQNKLRNVSQLILTRNAGTAHDYANTMCGKREYVGFGVNGSPNYADFTMFPMPAIRFRESDEKICGLREKEKGDWKQLSKDDVKTLYRYSFCQTYAEFQAPTGEWKLHLGILFWVMAFAIVYELSINVYHQDLPRTFSEDARQAQLKRMIALEMNPITGLASKWDYDVGDWK